MFGCDTHPKSVGTGLPVQITVAAEGLVYNPSIFSSGVDIDVSGIGPTMHETHPMVGTKNYAMSFRVPNGYRVGNRIRIRISQAVCTHHCEIFLLNTRLRLGTWRSPAIAVTSAGTATVTMTVLPLPT